MSLCVEHLSFGFHASLVLDDISFEIAYGNLVCLLGCNGAGKSTLLRCLLGLLPLKQGRVLVGKRDLSSLSRKEQAKTMAYIPQGSKIHYSDRALDLVLMGTTSQLSPIACPGKPQMAVAQEAFSLLGISHLAHRCYDQLSGGEQQMVLIARAIAQQAPILIMDEPCANLDYGNQSLLLAKIQELTKYNYLVLMSTHNPDHVLRYAHEALILQNKTILALSSPREGLDATLLEGIYGIPMLVQTLGGIPSCVPLV